MVTTTEEVRAYALSAHLDFDNWYAEEIRNAKEEAWDEAINFGMDIASELIYKYKPHKDNPYRKD